MDTDIIRATRDFETWLASQTRVMGADSGAGLQPRETRGAALARG